MRIYYGVQNNYVDVTELTFLGFDRFSNRILIPKGDHARSAVYGDHIYGTVKHIMIKEDINDDSSTIYDIDKELLLDIPETYKYTTEIYRFDGDITKKLIEIHTKLRFVGGSLNEEYPEQKMAIRFIRPDAKVLEIGANNGRNTVVIASLLKDSSNLVTLETLIECIPILEENRRSNELDFEIVNAALSKKPIYQSGWDSIPSDVSIEGMRKIEIIDYNSLITTNWRPDTLVADCEGALFYIFQDYPELLDDVSLIIMENDYHDIEKKKFVDSFLILKGFRRIYVERGGWGPCFEFFFETWAKC
ncbi:MAG: hypothetical protein Solivirus2_28 [Solivirus sp.]|uniref:FkbM family methyltransferase n=1 Tax=Solivirus sp. TaxID=2487772 RepID=A0A3G5AFK4_9VIRU|nr:MAG: hypothetical protein Solivirus2_28 [Solivirus sp.]